MCCVKHPNKLKHSKFYFIMLYLVHMLVGLKLNIYYFLARTKMFNWLITNMGKNIFGDYLRRANTDRGGTKYPRTGGTGENTPVAVQSRKKECDNVHPFQTSTLPFSSLTVHGQDKLIYITSFLMLWHQVVFILLFTS